MTIPKRTLLLTTPIYYVNDVPHVGHAYTTIAADTLTRARRLAGHDVFFLTGTDEHGQNIERIAREKGISEQEHCDRISAAFRALWERYDIRYDRFIRTTEDVHRRGVLKLWERLAGGEDTRRPRRGLPRHVRGWYCPRCEGFKDEEELRQPGNVCPDHERPCEWTEEENFFFRLSAYEGWLRETIESDRLLIRPESRKNEVLGVIKQGLKDFSVSRARVKWGIPVPEQPDHVLYVWVDALSNYITALGFADDAPDYRVLGGGRGDERLHLIGKDIIRFHCLYWPAILHAAGRARAHPRVRAGLHHEGRPQALEDDGQRDRPDRARRAPRARRGALLPAARGALRPRLGLHGRGLRRAATTPTSRTTSATSSRAPSPWSRGTATGKVPPRWQPPVPEGVGRPGPWTSARRSPPRSARRPTAWPRGCSGATRRSTSPARSPRSGAGSGSSTRRSCRSSRGRWPRTRRGGRSSTASSIACSRASASSRCSPPP